ncbi:MAG: hypothetical protein GY926_00465 [bacterium]|nr:hypothetical protein [bacterium]
MLILLLAIIPATSPADAQTDVSPDGTEVGDTGDHQCERPVGADGQAVHELLGRPVVGDKETHPKDVWRAGPEVQEWFEKVDAQLADSPNVLGTFVDDLTQTHVIVVGAGKTDSVKRLLKDPAPIAIDYRVSCRPLETLREIEGELVKREWHKRANDISYSFYTDPSVGRVTVVLPPDEKGLAEQVEARFGRDNILIEYGTIELAGRYNNGSAHDGGAHIGNSYPAHCTAGFAMDRSGGRWMASAYHCLFGYSNTWTSGSTYYGQTNFSLAPSAWPGVDALLVGDGNDQYSRVMWVDPCSPCTRLVSSKGNASSNSSICVNGANTGARCGLTVRTYTVYTCAESVPGVCWFLRKAEKPGSFIAQNGDSGAAMYNRLSGSKAKIRGMFTALERDQNNNLRHDSALFFNVSSVEASLGATTATACCNNDSW